jgi:hypothetical protein
MISILDSNNKLSEQRNSINITYPRTVQIIFGNYPYLEVIHNLIIDIKNNISKDMSGYTNVKGGMTEWQYFIDKPIFNNFLNYVINKHQLSHPNVFQYFFEKYYISDAWGNEIKPNDSLDYHTHPCWHGILYLTEGCDLILPELNIKITPKPGDYYMFPPEIMHGFDKYKGKKNRYSLIFNTKGIDQFALQQKMRILNERKKS